MTELKSLTLKGTKYDSFVDEVARKKDYVTPEMFGAKGDGVTDDTVAIQDAINTGKTVYFAEKTYIVTSLTVPNKTRLLGAGQYKTILQQKIGYSGDMVLVEYGENGYSYTVFESIVFKAVQKTNAVINVQGMYFTIENCAVVGGKYGILFSFIGSEDSGWTCNNKIVNNNIGWNLYGIYVQPYVGEEYAVARFNGNLISGNYFNENTECAICICNGDTNIITNNIIEKSQKYAIYVSHCYGVFINNNHFENNATEQVEYTGGFADDLTIPLSLAAVIVVCTNSNYASSKTNTLLKSKDVVINENRFVGLNADTAILNFGLSDITARDNMCSYKYICLTVPNQITNITDENMVNITATNNHCASGYDKIGTFPSFADYVANGKTSIPWNALDVVNFDTRKKGFINPILSLVDGGFTNVHSTELVDSEPYRGLKMYDVTEKFCFYKDLYSYIKNLMDTTGKNVVIGFYYKTETPSTSIPHLTIRASRTESALLSITQKGDSTTRDIHSVFMVVTPDDITNMSSFLVEYRNEWGSTPTMTISDLIVDVI